MLDTKKNGSVMIVGGGVTGMQSALDLADAGYYVYLVEKTGAIGGAMAQLDKVARQNAVAAQQLSAMSEEMQNTAGELQQSLAYFSI